MNKKSVMLLDIIIYILTAENPI